MEHTQQLSMREKQLRLFFVIIKKHPKSDSSAATSALKFIKMRCFYYWSKGSFGQVTTLFTVRIVLNRSDGYEDYKNTVDSTRLKVKSATAFQVKMQQVPQDLHIYFTNLVELDLNGCGLKKIVRDDLKGLKSLRRISLIDMQIAELMGKIETKNA